MEKGRMEIKNSKEKMITKNINKLDALIDLI
jgi:hypothetical protein